MRRKKVLMGEELVSRVQELSAKNVDKKQIAKLVGYSTWKEASDVMIHFLSGGKIVLDPRVVEESGETRSAAGKIARNSAPSSAELFVKNNGTFYVPVAMLKAVGAGPGARIQLTRRGKNKISFVVLDESAASNEDSTEDDESQETVPAVEPVVEPSAEPVEVDPADDDDDDTTQVDASFVESLAVSDEDVDTQFKSVSPEFAQQPVGV